MGVKTGLPKNANGAEIKYTWSEETVPTGYELLSNVTDGYETVITNKHTPAQIDIKVEKIWQDDNDQDGLRRPPQ